MNQFYLKLTLRKLFRGSSSSIIKIFGLALGIATSSIILFWIQNELSFDNFHEHQEKIHRLVVARAGEANTEPLAETLGELAPMLKNNFPQVEEFTRLKYMQKTVVSYREKKYYEERIAGVDSTFFDVFTFPLSRGNEEDIFDDFHKIAMSESMAKKYFGNSDPLGRIILVDSITVKVAGVFEDVPPNSHLNFDMLCSIDLLYKLGYKHVWGYFTYFLIDEQTKTNQLASKMTKIAQKNNNIMEHFGMELGLQKLADIHFNNSYGSEIAKTGDKQKIRIFTVIAFFILIVASLNYVNLNIAENTRNINDLAIMKSLGARKRQILWQYVIDAIVYLLISCMLALAIIEMSHPFFGELMGTEIQINYFGIDSLLVFCVMLFVAMLTILPVFYLSRFSPRNIIQTANSLKNNRLSLRIVLVIVQFTISIILILSMLFTSRQIRQMMNEDVGYNRENLVYFPARKNLLDNYKNVKHDLLSIPTIESATMSSCLPFNPNRDIPRWKGKDENFQIMAEIYGVDYDFAKTLGIEIIEGRDFSMKYKTDETSAFLLSEEALKQMGFDDPFTVQFKTSHKEGKIVGVFKTLRFQSFKEKVSPLVVFIQNDLTPVWLPNRGVFIARYKEGTEKETFKKIEKIWNKYNRMEPFEYGTFEEATAEIYEEERKMGNIYLIFSILAIIISCLGLFGISSFMSNQRSKEISIRKVNGASSSKIMLLLSKVFVRWVVVSFVIACPIAFYLIDNWLQNFLVRTTMHWWIFAIAGLGVMFIALATVISHTFHASRRNPVDVLRYE